MSNGPVLSLDAVNLTSPTELNLTYKLTMPGLEPTYGEANHTISFINYDSSLHVSLLPGKVKTKAMNSLSLNFDAILKIEGGFLEAKQGQVSDSFEIIDRFPMNIDYSTELSMANHFEESCAMSGFIFGIVSN